MPSGQGTDPANPAYLISQTNVGTYVNKLGETRTINSDKFAGVGNDSNPDGSSSTIVRNDNGLPLFLQKSGNAYSNSWEFAWDSEGNLETLIDRSGSAPDPRITTYTYNAKGQPLTTTEPNGCI